MTDTPLAKQRCIACEGGIDAIEKSAAIALMSQLNNDWQLSEDGKSFSRNFRFKNYYETPAFANAAAYIAHDEDHHPEMTISYRDCHISYTTHAIGGLSQNDFICAAITDRLILE